MGLLQMTRDAFAENRILYTLFLVSILAHVAVFGSLVYHYGPQSFYLSQGGVLDGNDGQHYVIIAKNIVEGHGYSRFVNPPYEADALRTPLLSLYFVPFFYFGGLAALGMAIFVLNFILALAPLVMYRLSRMFLSQGYAVLAALALGLDPLYLYRSQLAEPDALFLLVTLCVMYFFIRNWKESMPRYLYFASALLGIAILVKPSALYVAILLFASEIAYIFLFKKKDSIIQLKQIFLGMLILILVISPWLVRNRIEFGVWGISSIGGFNLYEFYTVHEKMPDEKVPDSIMASSREPTRFLANQKYFSHIAFQRIAHAPVAYAKEQLIGTVRNLFVSELPVIYYYGHSAILPFPYNPESRSDTRAMLLRGDVSGAVSGLLHDLPKVIWFILMTIAYVFAFIGWLYSWKKDRMTFAVFAVFLVIFAYFVVACGPYVDAKYRMPAVPLVHIVALYGFVMLRERLVLRFGTK